MELNRIIQGDCLKVMRTLEAGSVDMVLADLPYGATNLSWDTCIDLVKFWKEIKRVRKDGAIVAMTAQQPFATDVINSNRKYFKYEWIWEKTMALGFLSANKAPLRSHENILIFAVGSKPQYNPQKTKSEMRIDGW